MVIKEANIEVLDKTSTHFQVKELRGDVAICDILLITISGEDEAIEVLATNRYYFYQGENKDIPTDLTETDIETLTGVEQ